MPRVFEFDSRCLPTVVCLAWAAVFALMGGSAAAQTAPPSRFVVPTDTAPVPTAPAAGSAFAQPPAGSAFAQPPAAGSNFASPQGGAPQAGSAFGSLPAASPQTGAPPAGSSFSAAPAEPAPGAVIRRSDPPVVGSDPPTRGAEPLRPLRTASAAARSLDSVVPRPETAPRPTAAPGNLPSASGQVWREYDITAYTNKVTNTQRPEAAVLDWIRRETGSQAWQGEVAALLIADRRAVRVYHTPEMQARVAEIVERFTARPPDQVLFSVQILGVGRPDWRVRAQQILRPLPTETPGTQAWSLRREDAALLTSDLTRRGDVREYGSPQLRVQHGQGFVLSQMRPRSFVQSYSLRQDPGAWPVLEPQTGRIDEGLELEFGPLLSLDGKRVDAHLKCIVRQVEKMHVVLTEGPPTATGPRQRLQVEVPQLAACQVDERLQWNTEDVIVLSLGMIPTPAPQGPKPLLDFSGAPERAEMLLLFSAVRPSPTDGAPAPVGAPAPGPPGALPRY